MICCSYSSRENVSHNSNSHNSNTSTNCTISYLSRVMINFKFVFTASTLKNYPFVPSALKWPFRAS